MAAQRQRPELNTEGILFYKVWNGHAIQLRTQVNDMPAFQGRLSRDEVWTVVEHLKVLRTPRPQGDGSEPPRRSASSI